MINPGKNTRNVDLVEEVLEMKELLLQIREYLGISKKPERNVIELQEMAQRKILELQKRRKKIK